MINSFEGFSWTEGELVVHLDEETMIYSIPEIAHEVGKPISEPKDMDMRFLLEGWEIGLYP